MSPVDMWKIVEQRRRKERAGRRIYVSLNGRGEIAMNPEAFWQIDEPVNVTLLYDVKRRMIGVKVSVTADGDFFRVRRYGRGGRMRIVRAGRLLKQFGLTVERTLVFTGIEFTDYKGAAMMLLSLDASAEVTPKLKLDR